MAPTTTTFTLFTLSHLLASIIAAPCIFHKDSYQMIYGIRKGIVHFRLNLHHVPYMTSGWTGVGFGNGMINEIVLERKESYQTDSGSRFFLKKRKINSIDNIHLNERGSMLEGLDAIIIRVMNGRVNVTDEYVRGYTSSFPDRLNNIMVHSTLIKGGMISVTFSRSANSVEYPYDSPLLGCQPWKFVIGFNRIGPNGELYHHATTPVHKTVCIDECRM
ncbi:hypothetical protein DICVIV_09445 [Dictyocaulus viviparus]|uniref:Uncharacterized protein n=1 Tax=Dictyocaulus viviparus TaxID=29172 RepID=A0A0D8XL20_DICVI|nr:hypothetical protein DICVIV_09445 [Dictyocaulus viviparus]